MEEQFKQQFDKMQNSCKAFYDAGQKVTEPALRSSEIAFDSIGQLVKDQFEFGRACLDINRKQMEAAQNRDLSALTRDNGMATDYYDAVVQYGEALRQNAENTCNRMLAIGRESATAFADAGNVVSAEAAKTAEQPDSTESSSSNTKKPAKKS